MITGELRQWRRHDNAIIGFVYNSDIWDDGEEATFIGGTLVESVNFYLLVCGHQTYRLSKDEERG